MRIYIVLYETTGHGYFEETRHASFEGEKSARDYAMDKASNNDEKLQSVFRLDTTTRKVTEYELTLEYGRLELLEVQEEEGEQ